MDRFDKIANISFVVIFGGLGIAALVCAICGATHQFFVAAIGIVMSTVHVIEVCREEQKKRAAKRRPTSRKEREFLEDVLRAFRQTQL